MQSPWRQRLLALFCAVWAGLMFVWLAPLSGALATGAGWALAWLVHRLIAQIQSLQSQHAKQHQRLAQYLYHAHEAIIVCDQAGMIEQWNPAAETLLGYHAREVLGKPLQTLLLESNRRPHDIMTRLQDTACDHYEVCFIQKNFQPVRCEVTALQTHSQADSEYALLIQDVTEKKQNEQVIQKLAYYDPLTGLENRHFFSENVDSYLAQKPKDSNAFFLIDLDGFKQINDTLGHAFGDQLLKVIAKRLNHTLEGGFAPPRLCRFGGDEFLVLVTGLSQAQAQQLAKILLDTLHDPIRVQDEELHLSASLGMAFYPQHGRNLGELLRHADSAMYEAKAQGKNTYAIYHNTLDAKLSERLQIERGLRRALADDDLTLYYQPQLDTQTQSVTGVEALLRWTHPELGPVPPDLFIQIAEQSGLINEVGDWVLDKAITQLKLWQNTPFEALNIAINVSSHQLEDPRFLKKIRQRMAAEALDFHKLEMELTERSIMSNAQDNVAMLNQIRAQGLTISVDDFGTGYSSLSYLKRFPLNILKIDKSFVQGLPTDTEDTAITHAIIHLAHSLNMKVIAEGVETQAQYDCLAQAECDMVQGYHYCKPLPVDALQAWLLHFDPVHAVSESVLNQAPTGRSL